MGRMLSRVALRGSLSQVRHLSPVRPRAARGLVADVYAQAERDFGMLAPPVILHSPAPEVLAACWTLLRESLLADGAVPRAVKEAVATEVSAGNACPYCVDVHRETLRGLAGEGRGALRSGPVGDGRAGARSGPAAGGPDAAWPGLARAAAWARAAGTRDTAVRPPLHDGHVRELTAVAVTFHYLNRMVNVFLGDSPLPPHVPPGARGPAMRLLGLLMRPAARRPVVPGQSRTLLPVASLPADLAWARGTPYLEGAFARAAAAIEEGGRRSAPGPVRELLAATLEDWDGRPAGLGRGWAAEAASALPPAQRPAGRLALLTALASYQVDEEVVGEFLRAQARERVFRTGPGERAPRAESGERALVELTAWASLAAARRAGAWLPSAPQDREPAPSVPR
ncbi:carboxymuconolactone decarboxylase family protein [Planobispora takensis]|uniref:Alkyl hydroperoxide reductase AhpD n=1 Tax=Planobispora takensis TaxID=1367882 RepID=A0A8J3T0Q1_9ACTN|nr:carboxymuconolactone decarboxylase family protein [Planobispora takensis]GII02148.1 alkyl hydroperoxide reductase AhpD [Planobispora takensis]